MGRGSVHTPAAAASPLRPAGGVTELHVFSRKQVGLGGRGPSGAETLQEERGRLTGETTSRRCAPTAGVANRVASRGHTRTPLTLTTAEELREGPRVISVTF